MKEMISNSRSIHSLVLEDTGPLLARLHTDTVKGSRFPNMKELRTILNNIKEEFSEDINDHDVFIMEEHSINWFPYELK